MGGASGQQSGNEPRQGKAHEGEAIEEIVNRLRQEGKEPNASQGGKPQEGATPEGQQGTGEQNPQPGENQAQNDQQTGQPGANPMQGTSGAGRPMPMQGEQPMGTGQSPMPGEQQNPGENAGEGDPPDPMNRLPGDKQGENPTQQKSGGNAGGQPMGPNKTDMGEMSKTGEGQEKKPGEGTNGDAGAGTKSQDKTGSGAPQEQNRDRPKEQDSGGGKASESNPSSPSTSKKQSNSKGGSEGDRSGGGKKGGGQSGGQEGNDSAGSHSEADQGAGKASERGMGETGDKSGTQQEAAGKTGQSGSKAGEGSKTGEQTGKSEPGEPMGDLPPMKPMGDEKQEGDPSDQPGERPGGKVVRGGGTGDRPEIDYGPNPEAAAGDAANLEYARKATELALQKLKDQEHDPDPELLDKLGWTKEDLAEFLNRWEALQKAAKQNPDGKRELDEALRSLGLRDPASRKRAGGATSDNQRDLLDSGSRSSPPPKYRDLFDAFRKGAARSP